MKIALKRDGDEIHVAIQGSINEDADTPLRELLEKLNVAKVIFDLEQVEQLNSVGAFYWFQFCQNLAKNSIAADFEKCSVGFIECCNIYSKLAPTNRIVSLFVPTECESCGAEKFILCKTSQLKAKPELPPSTCDACQGQLLSQVDLSEYLQFLQDTTTD